MSLKVLVELIASAKVGRVFRIIMEFGVGAEIDSVDCWWSLVMPMLAMLAVVVVVLVALAFGH